MDSDLERPRRCLPAWAWVKTSSALFKESLLLSMQAPQQTTTTAPWKCEVFCSPTCPSYLLSWLKDN